MASEEHSGELSYRKRDVDQTLRDHEARITQNERRWLVAKGALGTLAVIKGIDVAVAELITLL